MYRKIATLYRHANHVIDFYSIAVIYVATWYVHMYIHSFDYVAITTKSSTHL